MSDKRLVPPGSREEAQIAESVLYGVLWQMLNNFGPLIRETIAFQHADVHPTGEPDSGVVYDGLTIQMASGDYDVKITRTKVNP